MNILSVCDYLKQKLGVNVNGDYYNKISQWADWYKGYYKPFHSYTDYNGRETVQLDRYSLKMAKKICEDWANMLLNEETMVVVENKEAQSFIDDVLERNDFFANANTLIEKAFALGTGAVAVRLNNYKIALEYITADCIIPISYNNKAITEVAFVSEHTHKGKKYIYLETHLKNKYGNYVIRNEYLDENFNRVKTDNKTVEEYDTKSDVPWFVIFKPNITNNIEINSPMGISVYANSIDILKGVDLAYDNLCTDFFLGGKMVLMNESIIAKDQNGTRIVPQHSKKRLFMSMGDSIIDGKMYEEYNPQLRVDENVKGVQSQLNYLSSKCGLGERYYSFEIDKNLTATEVIYGNANLFRNVKKHEKLIAQAIKGLIQCILMLGGFDEKQKITVVFDDSVIEDKSKIRGEDRLDIQNGIMQKWEYRMKHYGETKELAQKMVSSE